MKRRRKSPVKFLKMPKLKVFQQIIVGFILVVLVPLVGVSVIIYSTNQKALKKELTWFARHTAEATYREMLTEMSWQQKEARLMKATLLKEYRRTGRHRDGFALAANNLFALSDTYEAVGLYDQQGLKQNDAYRNFSHTTPELRLARSLALQDRQEAVEEKAAGKFKLLYTGSGDLTESNYFLRMILPVDTGESRSAGFLVLQKRFDYLKDLIESNRKTLADGLYIIDNTGHVIAGPGRSVAAQQQISTEDLAFFNALSPGIAGELFSEPLVPEASLQKDNPNPEETSLEKVMIKIPDIQWGILIESPYHIQQQYVITARNQSLMVILGMLALVVILGVFYIVGLSRNFRQLFKSIKAMAEGNYSRRIRLITNFFTPYEIVFLAAEFNRMARKMAEAWENVQQLNTELRAANTQLSQLDALKSNLIDTVSHELRTPLTNIKGYTSRLLRYDETLDHPTRTKSLKVIKQQTDRLSRLVEDLLVIPDLEQQNLRVFPDRIDLLQVVDHSVHLIESKEMKKVHVDTPANTQELFVLADPDRLEQILINLLDNAVKYSILKPDAGASNFPEADSGIAVSVTFPDKSNLAEITVSNPAALIPQEALPGLLEKFKRLDEGTTRTTRGSGLGLFITKGLVEAMGGVIGIDYQDGYFQVKFTLPVYEEVPVPVGV